MRRNNFTRKAIVEPELLSGAKYSCYIEELLNNASDFIYIISPFIKLNKRIESILELKSNANCKLSIIAREYKDFPVNSYCYIKQNLHSKLIISEKAAIFGSLNLYSYSQENNNELGIHINRSDFPTLYQKIRAEALKLFSQSAPVENHNLSAAINGSVLDEQSVLPQTYKKLQSGKKYAKAELLALFNFKENKLFGINKDQDGNILVFAYSKSSYPNYEKDGVIYYCGQKTGAGEQKLIYGNKTLYDAFEQKKPIYYFSDDIFRGMKYIAQKPFKQDGIWRFPLKNPDS